MNNKQPDYLELYHVQILKEGREEWFTKNKFTTGTVLNQYYQDIVASLGITKHIIADNAQFADAPMDQIVDCSEFTAKDRAYHQMCYHRNLIHEKLIETTSCLSQYLKWINEEIFENVRSKEFPHLPSRKSCLWLCDFDSLHKWLEIISERSLIKILKVKAFGKFHNADGGWISADTHSIDEFHNRARNYWSGKTCVSPEPEMLFEGEITVLNEYKAIEEIDQPNPNFSR